MKKENETWLPVFTVKNESLRNFAYEHGPFTNRDREMDAITPWLGHKEIICKPSILDLEGVRWGTRFVFEVNHRIREWSLEIVITFTYVLSAYDDYTHKLVLESTNIQNA